MKLNSKLPKVGTTIFSVMSALANKHKAVNLSQGFPDFKANPALIDLVSQYMQKGFNQYVPMLGVIPLREQIALKSEEMYGAKLNPDTEITVTVGASEALFNALACSVEKDDEVIIFEPAYDLYIPVIELFGGKVISIPLNEEDYSIDWDKVKQAINPKTKLIIINTPHNPTAAVLAKSDMQTLREIVKDSNIMLIGDEVYEHIIFDDLEHESLLRYPELRERSFVISSFGKTYHTTGWKVGYCVAPAEFTKEFRKIHQFNAFTVVAPMQYAIADFMKAKEHYLELPHFYQERRDKFRALLAQTPFKLLDCKGTYFQLASYAHLSQEKDLDYAQRITKEVGVATIPLSPFYAQNNDNKVLRFCFAKEYNTMEEAIERIIKNKEQLAG